MRRLYVVMSALTGVALVGMGWVHAQSPEKSGVTLTPQDYAETCSFSVSVSSILRYA